MAQSRRGEILEVAARIFNEKGYLNATLEDVGDEFGFTRAALYYYFKSKQAILVAIVEDAAVTLMGALKSILAEDLPPAGCLRRIVVNHVEVLHSRPDVFGVFLAEPTSLPEDVRGMMLDAEREYIDLVATVYERGVKDKVFSREFAPKATILLILGMVNNTAHWLHPAAIERGEFDPTALGEMAYRMVSGGFALLDTASSAS
ncbi:MAG TPA: TetR/AcrR family transcriptional regulator [Pseudonocardiaceae bacterium]